MERMIRMMSVAISVIFLVGIYFSVNRLYRAINVVATINSAGKKVNMAGLLFLISHAVTAIRPSAAKSWLAAPNIGQMLKNLLVYARYSIIKTERPALK